MARDYRADGSADNAFLRAGCAHPPAAERALVNRAEVASRPFGFDPLRDLVSLAGGTRAGVAATVGAAATRHRYH
jgi:hypothetical protein